MAFEYDTTNTGVFFRIGKLVKYVNAHSTMPLTTLPAELKAIADPFELADMTNQIETLYDAFAGWQDDQVALRQTIAGYADAVLSDRVSVLEPLSITSASFDDFFWETLRRKMITDAETIDASSVSAGTVTAGTNTGNGTIVLVTQLDGFNPPGVNGGPALATYANELSQLAVTETMTFECVTDASSGATSGSESFSWRGAIAGPKFDWRSEGSGEGPFLTVAGDGGLVTDGGFTSWTGNTPDNWTIATGAATTNILHETTNVYRGTDGLKFLGTGATASISVTQSLLGQLGLGRMYYVGLRVKCSTNAPAAGAFALKIALTPQNGSPATTTLATIAAAALTTSWVRAGSFFTTPLQALTAATLTIEWTGTPTNAVSLYLDSVAVVPAVYHGGIGAVALPGQTDFIRGDKLTSAITNNDAGTFQKFFRRQYGVQLPSDDSGTETILDSLAE